MLLLQSIAYYNATVCNRTLGWRVFKCPRRYLSTSLTNSCENSVPDLKKYSKTLLLPSTTFPNYVSKRSENERYVQKVAGFSSLYAWQRQQSREKEFVLHDGPPYANGNPHIGHAVNKILKDITLRHKLLQGYKVHYIPGWDCHGLPIELKALEKEKSRKGKKQDVSPDVLTVRAIAKKFAEEAIDIQRLAFERWAVLADWNNIYRTFDAEYIKRQLHLFGNLYENGYIYQAYKPVHYSPSSRTSLAEAELEYVSDHCSPSVHVALLASNLPQFMQEILDQNGSPKVHLAVWTTTPWTLPFNEAICFSANKLYSLVIIKKEQQNIAVIWAKELLKKVEDLGAEVITELCSFEGSELNDITYRHPLSDRQCPCLPGDHVTMRQGTGLVHTAPAHGQDDFIVALHHKIPVDCKVDEEGCYQDDIGPELQGKHVLNDGNEAVIHLINMPDGLGGPTMLLNKGTLTHSYPYDWRTKKPVIIRASKQWFIDTEKLKDKALEALEEVQILSHEGLQSSLALMIKRRPYWCISRQRVWGCPIPVFYDITTDQPITDRRIIEHVAEVIRVKGGDAWWELPEEELLPPELVTEYRLQGKRLPYKGSDILDIWFDSGSSWHCVLGSPSADLYLEGIDQFTGWFQSSLLTSSAVTGKAPYRKLYVHGFTVDEEGKKMSKSVGNVVDPYIITDGGKNLKKDPAYGADVLRWWVVASVPTASNMMVGKNILDICKEKVHKIRATLRFLLSFIGDYHSNQHSLPVSQLRPIDQYMLHLLHNHIERMWQEYENFRYHAVAHKSHKFIAYDVSAFYINLMRDRLYCESRLSSKRMSALVVVQNLFNHLLLSVAPILPHLTEEINLHHPTNKDWRVFHRQTEGVPDSWKQPQLASVVEQCLTIKEELNRRLSSAESSSYSMQLEITAGGHIYEALKVMQSSEDAEESGLCELLQMARVILHKDDQDGFSLKASKSKKGRCFRCRKFTAQIGEELCSRCQDVVTSDW